MLPRPPRERRPRMATPVAPNEANDAGSRNARNPCFDAASAAGIFRSVPGSRQSRVIRVHHSSKRISVNVWGCPICGARSMASTGRGFLLMGVGASDTALCFGLVGSVSIGAGSGGGASGGSPRSACQALTNWCRAGGGHRSNSRRRHRSMGHGARDGNCGARAAADSRRGIATLPRATALALDRSRST